MGKKEAQRDSDAIDPESRLLFGVVPGKRTAENYEKVVEDAKVRTGGRTDILITSDEHAPYAAAIEKAYSVEVPEPDPPRPGQTPAPKRTMPQDLCYATVRKTRERKAVPWKWWQLPQRVQKLRTSTHSEDITRLLDPEPVLGECRVDPVLGLRPQI